MELGWCVDKAIPYSQYLDWNEEDQNLLVEYLMWQQGICQQCGSHPDEWLDEAGKAKEPPPFLAATRKCLGCATLEQARKDIPKDESFVIMPYLTRNRTKRIPEWLRRLSP
jgi:hypothetical protein